MVFKSVNNWVIWVIKLGMAVENTFCKMVEEIAIVKRGWEDSKHRTESSSRGQHDSKLQTSATSEGTCSTEAPGRVSWGALRTEGLSPLSRIKHVTIM